MATTTKTAASEGVGPRGRIPRLRTNVVVGETADGVQTCLYAGSSVDEAMRVYAQLRTDGGWWRNPDNFAGIARVRFSRALLCLDPRSSKHCSFSV